MKIAFISYEYPPDTAEGGIATYVYQAARMLTERGHQVEVFSGSRTRTQTSQELTGQEGAITVHRVLDDHSPQFPAKIGQVFAERHAAVDFDVLEGPEWLADAQEAVRLVPGIPLVLKLHTPTYLLRRNDRPPFISRKNYRLFRNYLSAKRHRRPALGEAEDARERRHAAQADEIAAPSQAIGREVTRAWRLDSSLVAIVPMPYTPVPELLNIPIETETGRVTFLGRLEMRKGVLALGQAIPRVLRRHPQVKFRFVGRPMDSPRPGQDMQQYLEEKLHAFRESVEFCGAVPSDSVPRFLAETDICVFPSVWESYGFVCLEAMAAGRGVVGSSAGGMAELLDQSRAGLLVPPRRPDKIAEALGALISDPARRRELGQKARARCLSEYSTDQIGAVQEESYRRAIERRRRLGPRM